VNKDIVPHNIAIDTKQKALSSDLQSGDTFVYKVNKSLTYICGFHPSMKGKLILSQ
jgi:plastocyanin